MWTQFWDMHSSGGTKEAPYEKIYIEAPNEEAKIIFYNRFGHSPDRVTCTCCGEDYSISEEETLEQLTGFHRNCTYGKDGYIEKQNEDVRKYVKDAEDEEVWQKYLAGRDGKRLMTLEQYKAQPDVLLITADEIKPNERVGEVPVEGYVWM
ncbi:hypothetical protein [Acinetobacter sp.]|uniref:hypothetical protein n=1 Tax=Acinetobacter sp. TaxID=472 RepID=UPI003750822A